MKRVLSYFPLFLNPREFDERIALFEKSLSAEIKRLYNEFYVFYMNGIENGIKRDPKRIFDIANYKRKTLQHAFW
jgi:hypothetical protein